MNEKLFTSLGGSIELCICFVLGLKTLEYVKCITWDKLGGSGNISGKKQIMTEMRCFALCIMGSFEKSMMGTLGKAR